MQSPRIGHAARIVWNASRSSHPARVASWRALDAIVRRDRARYISLYAPDGVIHDPVGKSDLDPTGSGHRGHSALGRFWDQQISTIHNLSFVVHTSLATDHRVANSFTIRMERSDGNESTSMECIFIYRVNDAGLLARVTGYWEVPDHDVAIYRTISETCSSTVEPMRRSSTRQNRDAGDHRQASAALGGPAVQREAGRTRGSDGHRTDDGNDERRPRP
jgi:steroid Delta-isomerase